VKTHVALLRGINVGGRHKLPMKELVALFEEVGSEDVRTYIQSGNVVFRSASKSVAEVTAELEWAIEARFGFEVPIVMRSVEALCDIVARNPFVAAGADPRHLHVGFLSDAPTEQAVASLDPARTNIDSFRVLGTEVHLHVPGGMGRTKLTTDWFDRRLGTTMTVRNWRTVNKLIEIAGGEV
jgi:uncharacterized protein (DUF1697 family)